MRRRFFGLRGAALLCLIGFALSGCFGLFRGREKQEITVQNIIDANYITSLVAQYSGVTVLSGTEAGDVSTTVFFVHDGEIARCEEGTFGGEPFCGGAWGGMTFSLNADGTVAASAPADEFAGDPPAVSLTDSKGRTYSDNAFLLYPLFDGDVQMAKEYNGVDVTVHSVVEGVGSCDYTVDRDSLVIRHYFESWDSREVEVSTAGADASWVPPTKAAEELLRAGGNLRTVRYHAQIGGVERDYAFRVPADWEFRLEVYGDIAFYADAGLTAAAENRIPADGEDHELWLSDAKG